MEPFKLPDAFPCAWPVGWERTPARSRRKARYRTIFTVARSSLIKQLRLFKASNIVISSNIPTKRDGLPYAGFREPEDPAIAVYWTVNGATSVIACDEWRTAEQNLQALNTAVKCLRQLELSGVTQVMNRAFLGLLALPANTPTRGWREVFGFSPTEPVSINKLEKRYLELVLACHPDIVGGSHSRTAELNAARDVAREWFRSAE